MDMTLDFVPVTTTSFDFHYSSLFRPLFWRYPRAALVSQWRGYPVQSDKRFAHATFQEFEK